MFGEHWEREARGSHCLSHRVHERTKVFQCCTSHDIYLLITPLLWYPLWYLHAHLIARPPNCVQMLIVHPLTITNNSIFNSHLTIPLTPPSIYLTSLCCDHFSTYCFISANNIAEAREPSLLHHPLSTSPRSVVITSLRTVLSVRTTSRKRVKRHITPSWTNWTRRRNDTATTTRWLTTCRNWWGRHSLLDLTGPKWHGMVWHGRKLFDTGSCEE